MSDCRRIVFATGNANKVREVREIMDGTGYDIVSLKDIGMVLDVEETGETYLENARIKARAVAENLPEEYAGCLVMSDDSGFEVDYLDRQPGIYSSRFMGEDTPYSIKNRAIIDKLEGVPMEQRSARFCCAVVCVFPDGHEADSFATYEGAVAYEAKGTNGFGYDPIFWVPQYGKTDGELPPEVKNTIGHRGKALRMMRDILEGGKHEV
ncbi:MAG: RdgB/HAM1 family non-canonical purine NTP pyrophosphatase [Lachnospiraceae bacterium]|nr:RdgB/HAM1 family non-canonical purine NTP pyrophosphatase [Lachnospiraceae bacterium]